MYSSVIMPGGQRVENIDDLRKAIFPIRLKFHDGYKLPLPGYCCLCPVDIEATIAGSRFACEPGEFDPMDHILTERA